MEVELPQKLNRQNLVLSHSFQAILDDNVSVFIFHVYAFNIANWTTQEKAGGTLVVYFLCKMINNDDNTVQHIKKIWAESVSFQTYFQR